MRLLLGDWSAGWELYEYRLGNGHLEKMQAAARAITDPSVIPEKERIVLLEAEQGFGDTLQFVRFASVLAEKGFTVELQVQASLARLIECSRIPGVARIVPAFPENSSGLRIPLLSLGYVLGLRPDEFPKRKSYLAAPGLRECRPRSLRKKIVFSWGAIRCT